jgi:hypothetical protein
MDIQDSQILPGKLNFYCLSMAESGLSTSLACSLFHTIEKSLARRVGNSHITSNQNIQEVQQ